MGEGGDAPSIVLTVARAAWPPSTALRLELLKSILSDLKTGSLA
jgi:hypothetical protein